MASGEHRGGQGDRFSRRATGRLLLSLGVVIVAIAVTLAIATHSSRPRLNPKFVTVTLPQMHPNQSDQGFIDTIPAYPVVPTHRYSGSGNRVIGQLTLSEQSEVGWACSKCTARGFTLASSREHGHRSPFRVATSDATFGTFIVPAGTYRNVRIDSGGQHWVLFTYRPQSVTKHRRHS